MRLVYFMMLVLTIGGCASPAIRENEISAPTQTVSEIIKDKEFLYLGDKYPVHKAKLTREELRHDIAVLLTAFDRAYSGRDYLPVGVYDQLLKDVKDLGEILPLGSTDDDGDLLCSRLEALFWQVPDNHLYTRGRCLDLINQHRFPDVGKNVYPSTGYRLYHLNVDGKRIGLLSLGTSMPDKNDKSWKDFEKEMETLAEETDALILDLRGNRGGMSNNIRWLASFLYGNPAKMADEIIHERESAAVCALNYNEAVFSILGAAKGVQPAQDYLLKQKSDSLAEFYRLENKSPGWSREVRQGSKMDFNPVKGYDKPVRILIDRGCASSCEGGFARFLSHPKVKTYGTNTIGAIHYGDIAPLVLPNSGVIVFIPTTFREFSDGRFLEKIGYAPDVEVTDGKNALEEALKELTKLLP